MNLRGPSGNRPAIVACRALALAFLSLASEAQSQPPLDPAATTGHTFELRVAGRRPEGGVRTLRLRQGEPALLRCTADEPMTVHVHGYGLELPLRAGVPGTLRVDARFVGRFPVTAHLPPAGKAGSGHSHEPTLLYLEVHPR